MTAILSQALSGVRCACGGAVAGLGFSCVYCGQNRVLGPPEACEGQLVIRTALGRPAAHTIAVLRKKQQAYVTEAVQDEFAVRLALRTPGGIQNATVKLAQILKAITEDDGEVLET
jgi:hypothetical protein